MIRRRRMTPVLVLFSVLMLFSSLPARSGVHLWRVTELFSNADGTMMISEPILSSCDVSGR